MDNLKLLYVEDDIDTLEDTLFLLQRYFPTVYTATDGLMALEAFEEKDPDIVILDINIPKLNGIQVAQKIREINKKIPIIFLTAHSEKSKLLNAIKIGVISYEIKPFRIEDLRDSILKSIEIAKSEKVENSDIFDLGNSFEWNLESKELFYNSQLVPITKNERALIELLLSNKNRFFNAYEISDELYSDKVIEANSVVKLISRFKSKLKRVSGSKDLFIENIYNQGYRIKYHVEN